MVSGCELDDASKARCLVPSCANDHIGHGGCGGNIRWFCCGAVGRFGRRFGSGIEPRSARPAAHSPAYACSRPCLSRETTTNTVAAACRYPADACDHPKARRRPRSKGAGHPPARVDEKCGAGESVAVGENRKLSLRAWGNCQQSTIIGVPSGRRASRVESASLPLGGCPMGPTSTEGVVDATGRVFNTSRGSQTTHPGLYVTDAQSPPARWRYNQH